MSNKKDSINSQRLEKLFTSNRDLTLSSSKKSNQMPLGKAASEIKKKKNTNFVPNLTSRTVKTSENAKTDDVKKGELAKHKRGNRDERTTLKRGSNLIQTVGVFSEGIAAVNHRKHEMSRSMRENLHDDEIQRPRLTLKPDESSIRKSDVQVLATLAGRHDIEDSKHNLFDDPFNPIKIRKFNEVAKEEPLKDKIIKKEPIEHHESDQQHHQQPRCNHDSDALDRKPKEQFLEFFGTSSSDLMMFQFPDALPGKMMAENDEEKNVSPEISSKLYSNVSSKLFSLQNLNEGLIGKIVRYKSGRIKLFLGDSFSYNVESGIPAELQQHVVIFDTNPEERNTNLYSLGLVTSKHIICPDWNSIWA